MTNIINNFIEQNEKVGLFLEQIGRDYRSADKNYENFKSFLSDSKYNAILGIDLANYLQCLDKEHSISGFELSDISRLFDSLIKAQEYNIDTYVEAGQFEWSVMNDKQKAKKIIKSGIAKASEKLEELKDLLVEIEKGE